MDITSFYYIDSNIICIVVLGILLARTVKGIDWQLSQVFFSRVLFYYILYCIIDILWTLFDLGYLHNQTLFFLIYALNYVVSSLCAFYWFIYSEAVQGNKTILQKNTRIKYVLPLMILLFLGLFFFCILEFVFDLTLKGPFYTIYFLITTLTPLFYVLSAFINSIKKIKVRKFKSESNNMHILMGIYPIILFISTIVQILLPTVPIICYVIVISLLCVYFRSLDTLISVDSLTKLNNRNQLYSYVERISKDIDKEKWLFFIDVDKFKSINDTFGHLEGDNALVIVSTSLKESCKDYPSRFFIARYGGDEFLIIANKNDITDPNELKEKINSTINMNVFKNQLKYNLSVSVGYSLADLSKRTIEECLNEADEKLYIEKKAKRMKFINNVSTF